MGFSIEMYIGISITILMYGLVLYLTIQDQKKSKNHDLGQFIKNNAYWFSENISARNAIASLGEYLSKNEKIDMEQVRDVWRLRDRIDYGNERLKERVILSTNGFNKLTEDELRDIALLPKSKSELQKAARIVRKKK